MFLTNANRFQFLHMINKEGIVGEIGVQRGVFSKAILERLKPKKLHLIDPWEYQDREEYQADAANISDEEQNKLYNEVRSIFQTEVDAGLIQLHRDYSTNAVDQFADSYFDVLYVDGAHDYETVLDDLRKYSAKMKETGLLMGHDFTNHFFSRRFNFGVERAVQEFVAESDWHVVALDSEHWKTFVLAKDHPESWAYDFADRLLRSQFSVTEVPDELIHAYRQVRLFDKDGKQKYVTSFANSPYLDHYAKIEDASPASLAVPVEQANKLASRATGLLKLSGLYDMAENKSGANIPSFRPELGDREHQLAVLDAFDANTPSPAQYDAFKLAVRLRATDKIEKFRKALGGQEDLGFWEGVNAFLKKDFRAISDNLTAFLSSGAGSQYQRKIACELLIPQVLKDRDIDRLMAVQAIIEDDRDLSVYTSSIRGLIAQFGKGDFEVAINEYAGAGDSGMFRFKALGSFLDTSRLDRIIDDVISRISDDVVRSDAAPLALVCCDGKYFEQYASLFLSAFRQTNPRTALRIVVYNATPDVVELGASISDRFDVEIVHCASANTNRHFYASARFFHARDIVVDEGRDVIAVDIDNVVNCDLSEVVSGVENSASMIAVHEWLLPWQSVTVDCVVHRNTIASRRLISAVAAFLEEQTPPDDPARKNLWWVDQVAYFSMIERMVQRDLIPAVETLAPIRGKIFATAHVSGVGWAHHTKAEMMKMAIESQSAEVEGAGA